SDACGIASLSLSQTNFDCANIGTNSVTLTVTDNNGNSQTCTATVSVVDNQKPTIVCPGPITQNADPGQCNASVSFATTASDNCSATVAYDIDGTSINSPHTFPVGTTTVHAVASDQTGNTDECSFTVTVKDAAAPIVTCSAIPTASSDGACHARVPDVLAGVTVSDNCNAADTITLSQSPEAGTLVGPGTYTITVMATDAAGNSATCTTSFTVTDTTPPNVSCSTIPLASVDENCQAPVPDVSVSIAVSDNCSGSNAITVSQSPAAGTLVGLGSHLITVTATDG